MKPSTLRPLRALQQLRETRQCLPQPRRSLVTTSPHLPPLQGRARLIGSSLLPARMATTTTTTTTTTITTPPRAHASAAFHTAGSPLLLGGQRRRAHNDEEVPDAAPTTDFSRMDILGAAPAPSTSVDICSSDGFKLDSGVSVYHGRGVLLAGGEAFEWQPWGPDKRLLNDRGQWEVPEEAFALLDLLWPRPGMFYHGSVRARSHTNKQTHTHTHTHIHTPRLTEG